jgi:hypothetical protein
VVLTFYDLRRKGHKGGATCLPPTKRRVLPRMADLPQRCPPLPFAHAEGRPVVAERRSGGRRVAMTDAVVFQNPIAQKSRGLAMVVSEHPAETLAAFDAAVADHGGTSLTANPDGMASFDLPIGAARLAPDDRFHLQAPVGGCRLRRPRRFGRESDLPRLQRQVHWGLDGRPGDHSVHEVSEPSAKVRSRDPPGGSPAGASR